MPMEKQREVEEAKLKKVKKRRKGLLGGAAALAAGVLAQQALDTKDVERDPDIDSNRIEETYSAEELTVDKLTAQLQAESNGLAATNEIESRFSNLSSAHEYAVFLKEATDTELHDVIVNQYYRLAEIAADGQHNDFDMLDKVIASGLRDTEKRDCYLSIIRETGTNVYMDFGGLELMQWQTLLDIVHHSTPIDIFADQDIRDEVDRILINFFESENSKLFIAEDWSLRRFLEQSEHPYLQGQVAVAKEVMNADDTEQNDLWFLKQHYKYVYDDVGNGVLSSIQAIDVVKNPIDFIAYLGSKLVGSDTDIRLYQGILNTKDRLAAEDFTRAVAQIPGYAEWEVRQSAGSSE